jgi:hypothetical protein
MPPRLREHNYWSQGLCVLHLSFYLSAWQSAHHEGGDGGFAKTAVMIFRETLEENAFA